MTFLCFFDLLELNFFVDFQDFLTLFDDFFQFVEIHQECKIVLAILICQAAKKFEGIKKCSSNSGRLKMRFSASKTTS